MSTNLRILELGSICPSLAKYSWVCVILYIISAISGVTVIVEFLIVFAKSDIILSVIIIVGSSLVNISTSSAPSIN